MKIALLNFFITILTYAKYTIQKIQESHKNESHYPEIFTINSKIYIQIFS